MLIFQAWATSGQTRTRFKHFCKKKKKNKTKKQNKTIQLYCFDERNLQQNSEGKGKNAKQSFASHVLSLLLCAIDEVGKINRLPR